MRIDLGLDALTDNYAVFGNPVKHSKSPDIHACFARQSGLELTYQAIEVPVDNFAAYLQTFFAQSGKGLNITIPFKEAACSICNVLTDRAKRAASVNTIWFSGGAIHGDTTDGQGLVNDLVDNNEISINGKSVLILGAGGTVKSILQPLCDQNPKDIMIANRTVSRAIALVEKFSNDIVINACGYDDLIHANIDLMINATSLSLEGKAPALPENILNKDSCCYDLMYSNAGTVFMDWARDHGASIVLDGLGMLVEQAAESFQIWHGIKPETKPVIEKIRTTM